MSLGTKRIEIFGVERYDGEWVPKNLVEALAWLNEKLESIPVEHRHTAEIDIDSVSSYEDSHYATIRISYTRPRTSTDVAEEIAEQRRRKAEFENMIRQRNDYMFAMMERLNPSIRKERKGKF